MYFCYVFICLLCILISNTIRLTVTSRDQEHLTLRIILVHSRCLTGLVLLHFQLSLQRFVYKCFFTLFFLLFFEIMAVNGRCFFLGTPASSTSETGRHNMAESGVKHQNQLKQNLRLLITPLVSSHFSHEYVSIVILFIIFVYERCYDRPSDFDFVTYSQTCYKWGNGACKHWYIYLALLFPYKCQTDTSSTPCHIQESKSKPQWCQALRVWLDENQILNAIASKAVSDIFLNSGYFDFFASFLPNSVFNPLVQVKCWFFQNNVSSLLERAKLLNKII